jgi:predicted SprT family Zn-dependent metalloprotease
MNNETYQLRRKVMNLIYEAREVIGKQNMPRITIRICENSGRGSLGVARMGQNIVWINERTVTGDYKGYLREVVYHELCHALWAVEHDENCKLMCSTAGQRKPLTKAQCQRIFKKYWEAQ